jgi:mycothiol synthase
MSHRLRGWESEADYEGIRRFLRVLHELDAGPGGNWDVCTFDYWRWHWLENVVEREPTETRIWERADGEIVAVLNQGDPGVCHIHVHPTADSPALEEEMIDEAEARMFAKTPDGRSVLYVWADEDDSLRSEILARRGFDLYEGAHSTEHHGHRVLSDPVDDVPLPDGFVVRSMGGDGDLPARSLASWRAFHPGEPDEGCDKMGDWYRNLQRSPTYRRDLDVIAVAPAGEIASFAVCYYDESSRFGVFVLVGTAAAYQRKGLARAVMAEGLRRLRRLGARDAYVSWYEPPAGTLYESVGLKEEVRSRAWRRVWEAGE